MGVLTSSKSNLMFWKKKLLRKYLSKAQQFQFQAEGSTRNHHNPQSSQIVLRNKLFGCNLCNTKSSRPSVGSVRLHCSTSDGFLPILFCATEMGDAPMWFFLTCVGFFWLILQWKFKISQQRVEEVPFSPHGLWSQHEQPWWRHLWQTVWNHQF